MNSPIRRYFQPPDELYSFRLPDELFLMSHDEFTGKPLVAKRLLGAGLVGAVLIDLVATGQIAVVNGRVQATEVAPRHPEERGDYLMSLIVAQPKDHRVRTWCLNLGNAFYTMTANALIRADILYKEQPWWRSTARYPANDLYQSGRPLRWLEGVLRDLTRIDPQRTMLAGLVLALGANSLLDFEKAIARTPAEVRAIVDERVALLPGPFGLLVAGVDDAAATLAASAAT